MRSYCEEIETGSKKSNLPDLQEHFLRIKEWYKKQHLDFQELLSNEMYSALKNKLGEQLQSISSLSDNLHSKLSLFSVAEWVCKHILSCFSYGPKVVDGTLLNGTKQERSWFEVNYDFPSLVEILQYQLKKYNAGSDLNLYVLLEDRDVRNKLTHAGKTEICLSAIRFYNVLRDMLIFLEPESSAELPRFVYPKSLNCNINDFFAHANDFDFENNTTILCVGSLHDISREHKELLANLPWDFVIDFDGFSDFGGLSAAVKRKNVNKQLLTKNVAYNLVYTKGFTHWLKCGEFVNYTHAQNKGLDSQIVSLLTAQQPFYDGINFNDTPVYRNDIITKVIEVCATVHNPVVIVYLHGDEDIAKSVISACERKLINISYSFTGVYYISASSSKKIENDVFSAYISYGSDYSNEYSFLCGDLESFLTDLSQYRDQLPVEVNSSTGKRLPSINGTDEVSANDYTNLFAYFETLYTDIGSDTLEESERQIENYRRGGYAPWCAFATGNVVETMLDIDYIKHINKIKTNLGRIQQHSREKIFAIEHIPGIGGSTLLRKIGWDLHMDYPVLLIKKYDKQKTKSLITSLYDTLRKGIVILADSDLLDMEELERDIRNLDRPCVLIYSTRQSKNQHSENKIPLSKITSSSEKQLRVIFERCSPLSKSEINKKNSEYDKYITQDSSMHTPFIIGLYYMEKDFLGLKSYVEQIANEISDLTKYKAMAFICLADIYGQCLIPATLINNFINIHPSANMLEGYSHMKGIFIRQTKNGMTTYKSKHYLLSKKMLDFCCQKIYYTDSITALSSLALDFVTFMLKACENNFSELYRDILEKIFITSRSVDAIGQSNFSQIIEKIITPEARKNVLLQLAERTAEIADKRDVDKVPELFMMTAHFYGHLSRMCSKSDMGSVNFKEAQKYVSKAIEYMEMCNKTDPVVLHMYGESKLSALQQDCKELSLVNASYPEIDYISFEDQIRDTSEIFEKVAEAGSPEYAYTSKMAMYIEYLVFVYKTKNINTSADFNKLSDVQRGYQVAINELIESLDEISMGETSYSIFIRLTNKYRSNIMLNDFGNAINFYDNRLKELLQKSPDAVMEIVSARAGLVHSLLGKYKINAKDGTSYYSDIPDSDIDRILALLDATLEQGFDINRYHERQRRMSVCNTWFKIAKFSKRPIEQGIHVAQKWADYEEKHPNKDARPYYYLYVLYYLSILDGNISNSSESLKYQKVAYDKARFLGQNTENIRDLLVNGIGMSRLHEIHQINSTIDGIRNNLIKPMRFSGVLEKVEAKKGYVVLREPLGWIKATAKFKTGEGNTLSEMQQSHKVEFYGGFSFEQISAIDVFVKDIDANESLNDKVSKFTNQVSKAMDKITNHTSLKLYYKIGDQVLFLPKYIYSDYNNGTKAYVNGLVGETKAGVSIDDLLQYSENELNKHGGIQKVLESISQMSSDINVIVKNVSNKGNLSVSIYDTGKTLDEILILSPKNESLTKDNISKSEVLKNDCKHVDLIQSEEIKILKELKGKNVLLNVKKETTNGLSGDFCFNGITYKGLIPSLSVKMRKKYICKNLNVRVISCDSINSIILRII